MNRIGSRRNRTVGSDTIPRFRLYRNGPATGKCERGSEHSGASRWAATVCRVVNLRSGRCGCNVYSHAPLISSRIRCDYRRQDNAGKGRVCVILWRMVPASIRERPQPYVESAAVRRKVLDGKAMSCRLP